jgi:orotate phosphoribosyltransferase
LHDVGQAPISANDLLDLLPGRRGHFLLESGHHSDLWLDLELLCLRPTLLEQAVDVLTARLAPFAVEMVCGPLNEGAFVALLVAERMQVEFSYTERMPPDTDFEPFPVTYRLPPCLRERVCGRRVAIIDDVTNAGSAVRSTYAELHRYQAVPVVIASLVVLGEAMTQFAAQQAMPVIGLATMPNHSWEPRACPLCIAGLPLDHS